MKAIDLQITLERELFPFVEKPGRYCGGELNSVVKPRKSIDLMGVLCFPELYDIGMSHFGSQILYHIVNKRDNWAVGRSYMPWGDAEKRMKERSIPLYSLEYFEPIASAHWIGFSLQYELQYTNLVAILDLAGIPFYANDRGEDAPILIAGGPSTANAEPVAPFLDVILPGDGEEAIVAFCEEMERLVGKNASREEKLLALAKLPGAYLPNRYETERIGHFVVPVISENAPVVPAAKIEKLRPEDAPKDQVVPLVDVVHHRMAVEVMRGCTRGCRFCSAGYYYRPVRERPVVDIATQIEEGIESTGWADVGLLSLSTADYSQFGALLCAAGEEVGSNGIKVSLPSTRIDAVSQEEFALLDKLSPASSLTIAPEAGSQRLRNVINKDFSRETIISMVEELMKNNISTLKLYFMVGLPTETEADIDELIALVQEISNIVWATEHRRKVSVALSPFSPKPHTPFQWEELCDMPVVARRCKRVKETLRKKRNVKVEYRSPQMTFLETVFTRGDRALAPVIIEAFQQGARFDGWSDHFNLDRWYAAAEQCGVSLAPYVEAISLDQPLPWRAISMGLSESFLREERERAYGEAVTDDCREASCSQCGVCGVDTRMSYAAPADMSGIRDITERLANRDNRQPRGNRRFFRLRYSKGEAVRFLAHRNVMDIFDRAFKAARIPLAMSEGYRPRPRLSYGPPLPLAASGSGELMDIQMHGTDPLRSEQIQKYLPRGLQVVSIEEVPGKPRAITAEVAAAQWEIRPLIPIPIQDIEKRIAAFLAADIVTVQVEKKQKYVEIEIRQRVLSVEQFDGTIVTTLDMREGNACRPSDVLAALFPERSRYDFILNRTTFFSANGEQLAPL